MITLTIISFLILSCYLVYILKTIGIRRLPSLSDSYYKLGKKGYIFQIVLFLTAALLVPVLLEKTPEPFKFLAFFTTAPILFVAMAPKFKDIVLEGKVHVWAAKISAVFSIIWCIIMLKWLAIPVILGPGLLFYIMNRKHKQPTFFAEMVCFAMLYISMLFI